MNYAAITLFVLILPLGIVGEIGAGVGLEHAVLPPFTTTLDAD